jgi:chitobiase/beta-hexosaminidase-like protein
MRDVIARDLWDAQQSAHAQIIDLQTGTGAAAQVVTEASTQLKDLTIITAALRVSFLAVDPSGQFETGDPFTWTNTLMLRNRLAMETSSRSVELFVAPRGTIQYTIDGSEPRDGTVYQGAIAIDDGAVLLTCLEWLRHNSFPAVRTRW